MQYVFKDGEKAGTYPIKYFHICWYDRINGCFDEEFITPEEFTIHDLAYVETPEESAEVVFNTKVFVKLLNGEEYELKLEKLKK